MVIPKNENCTPSEYAVEKKAELDKKFTDIVSKVEEEVKKQWAASGIKPEEVTQKLAEQKDAILAKAT